MSIIQIVEIVIMGLSIALSIYALIRKYLIAKWEQVRTACSDAIEKAETLKGATGEQKKEFAMALLKAITKIFSDKKLSELIDTMVTLTKNVNTKK